MKSRLIKFALFMMLSLLAIPLEAQAATRTVRVGVYEAGALASFDKNGSANGFFVEMLNHIAKKEQWNVEYLPGSWQEGLDRLKGDSIDLVLCIGYTEARKQYMDFPKEYLLLNWGVLYRPKGSHMTSLLELEGKKVSALRGDVYLTAFLELVRQFNINVKIEEVDQYPKVFKAVESGEAAAGIAGNLYGILNENGRRAEQTPVIFSPIQVGYAVNRGKNGDLIAALDRNIAEMKADRASIYHRKLERLLGKKGVSIPKEAYWALSGIAGALLLAISFILLLRRQVKAKTEHLEREIAGHKLAEETILASKRRFKALIRNSSDSITILDKDGIQIFVSDVVEKMLGYTPAELVNIPVIEEMIHPDDKEATRAAFVKLLEGDEVCVQYRHKHKNGSWVYLEAWGTNQLENPDIRGIVVNVRDITDRRMAEEALYQSEVTFRKLFEDSSDAILLIDSSGVFVECNQAALDLLKMTREQFILLPPAAISPEFQPNGRRSEEAATDMIAQAYNKGLQRFDWTHINAEGGEFIVEVSLMPVTIKGELMLHTTWRDITERKQAEQVLQLSEKKYSSIFNLMPDMVGITRMADGFFVEVNEGFERLTGWKRDEVIGKSSLDLGLWCPKTRAEAVAILQEQGHLEGFEFKLGTKSGEQRDALMYLTPIVVQGEKCLYFMARDVTELKRAVEDRIDLEKQILHAQKLESLGVLAGGIAHDFNNLLTAIVGNADLALMRINPESPAVDNIKRIEQASARAADLAKQMLAYSGKGKFFIENLDMSRLVEEMLHMLEVSISKKALLRFNLAHPIPSVEADATQMRQIIMNLVINASEAIGDKSGVIAITTGCMDCDRNYLKDVWLDENLQGGVYVYLEIADSGCGMDKETMGKLFDPFFTTKFTGRGLGMAAVLGIVRGHKGAIKVYSELSRGTTFKILLPASDRPAEMSNEHTITDDWKGSGKVLLVDDEETIRGIGREMLQELGFTVITADDGREGIASFKANPDIAFVILDLTMPRMDGDQCFRELRQLNPDVKVIMSSGYSEQEVTEKFIGKGLAGFIQKPYRLSALKDAVRGFS